MSRNKLNQFTNTLAKAAQEAYNNEKFFVAALAVKASKAAENHPNDQTLLGISNYLNKKRDTYIKRDKSRILERKY